MLLLFFLPTALGLTVSREPTGNLSALVHAISLSWSSENETAPASASLQSGLASCRTELSGSPVRFPCNCLTKPGTYTLSISDAEGTSLWDEEIEVGAPVLSLIKAPPSHVTLNGTVTIRFSVLQLPCRTLDSKLALHLDVEYAAGDGHDYKAVYSDEVSSGIGDLLSLSYPCEIFDRAGLYRFVLVVVSGKEEYRVGVSNIMRTSWNEDYELQMKSDSLMPCSSGRLAIGLRKPDCPIEGDRVRLFVLHRTGAREHRHSPTRLIYQREEQIVPERHGVSFSCGSNFDIANPGYCFKYVSVLSGGLVRERTTQCVATEPRGHLPLDGAWSGWGEWGACSGSCGPGLRHRLRLCDSPQPLYGGNPCPGQALRTEPCNLQPCPNETWSEALVAGGECECGCTMKSPGLIVVATHCPSATWLVLPPPGFTVTTRVLRLSLSSSDSLLLRDGLAPTSRLLLRHPGPVPPRVIGTERGVRAEYRGHPNRSPKEWTGAVLALRFTRRESGGDGGSDGLSVNLLHLGIGILILVLILFILSFSGMGLWWYTRRKLSSNCALLASQSLHSSASSHPNDTLRVSLASNERVRQLLSPSQLKAASPTPPVTVAAVERSGEFQPLLRPVKTAGIRSKHLSKIIELPDEGMIASITTESTRLSGYSQKSTSTEHSSPETPKAKAPVVRRSIGIQLNSPALPLRRYTSVESRMSATSGAQGPGSQANTSGQSSGRPSSPLSFAGTEQDFEYDYYEPNLPGSYLVPTDWLGCGLESEIDIDQIIGDSELMQTPTHTPRREPGSDERISDSSDNSDKAVQSSFTGADLPRLPPTLFVSRPPYRNPLLPSSTLPPDPNHNGADVLL